MSPAAPLRVLVADDQPLVRAGMRAVLDAEPGIDVVAEAADGVEAVALARALTPDVAVLDLAMPGGDGVEAIRRLAGTGTRLLVLTAHGDGARVSEALTAGADGYLLKTSTGEQLVAAVRSAAAGDSPLSPGVLALLVADSGERRARADAAAAAVAALARLTAREAGVLRGIAAGDPDAVIARTLGISHGTVKTYAHRAMRKLGVSSRVQAVAVVHEAGAAGQAQGAPRHPVSTDVDLSG